MENAGIAGNSNSSTGLNLITNVPVLMEEDITGAHSPEQILGYFGHLKINNPDLYAMINQDAKELSRIFDVLSTDAQEVYVEGIRKYVCVQCGLIHDRKQRANDCRYSDLKLRPYVCHGACGLDPCDRSYVSKQLLNRHCQNDQVKMCGRCNKYQSKQNYARHVGSCQG